MLINKLDDRASGVTKQLGILGRRLALGPMTPPLAV